MKKFTLYLSLKVPLKDVGPTAIIACRRETVTKLSDTNLSEHLTGI